MICKVMMRTGMSYLRVKPLPQPNLSSSCLAGWDFIIQQYQTQQAKVRCGCLFLAFLATHVLLEWTIEWPDPKALLTLTQNGENNHLEAAYKWRTFFIQGPTKAWQKWDFTKVQTPSDQYSWQSSRPRHGLAGDLSVPWVFPGCEKYKMSWLWKMPPGGFFRWLRTQPQFEKLYILGKIFRDAPLYFVEWQDLYVMVYELPMNNWVGDVHPL